MNNVPQMYDDCRYVCSHRSAQGSVQSYVASAENPDGAESKLPNSQLEPAAISSFYPSGSAAASLPSLLGNDSGAGHASVWNLPYSVPTTSASSLYATKTVDKGGTTSFSQLAAEPAPASSEASTNDLTTDSSNCDLQSSAKSLFHSGTAGAGFPAQYYTGGVYGSQSLSSSLYGVDATNPYSAIMEPYGMRSLKTGTGGYSFPTYFGSSPATQTQLGYYHYGAADYMPYYPQPYPQYYSYATPSTTPTYHLSQLPPCTSVAETNGTAQYSLKDLSPVAQKPEGSKKTKCKKRKARDSSPSPDSEWERVFIWDLDETVLIYNSLLGGHFAQKFQKNHNTCMNCYYRMAKAINTIGDLHFFFQDLQECDQVHVDDLAADDTGQDLSSYNFAADGFMGPIAPGGLCLPPSSHPMRGGMDWMRKLAFRYRKMRELYNMCRDSNRASEILMGCESEQLNQLRSEIDELTDNWHLIALKSLSVIASRPRYANVLVTSSPLTQTMSKLITFNLASVFPVDNIYSSSKIGKEACFERVVQKFGKKATYVVVGDGREEESAAKTLHLPFWRVGAIADLVALHQALDLGHL